MFSKHWGKGEIARYVPFPTVFLKDLQTRKNNGLFGKGLDEYVETACIMPNGSTLFSVNVPNFRSVHISLPQ